MIPTIIVEGSGHRDIDQKEESALFRRIWAATSFLTTRDFTGVLVLVTIDSVHKQTNRQGLAGEKPGEEEVIIGFYAATA